MRITSGYLITKTIAGGAYYPISPNSYRECLKILCFTIEGEYKKCRIKDF
jgi:hypothetical protein